MFPVRKIISIPAAQVSMQLALQSAGEPSYLFLKDAPDAELMYGNSSLVQQIFW
jgi:hypothetical protein